MIARPKVDLAALRPALRRLLADAAIEAAELASRGMSVTFTAYGITGEFLVVRAPKSLPQAFLRDRACRPSLEVALQCIAAEAYSAWLAHGQPSVAELREREPEWLRDVIDEITHTMIASCSYAAGLR